MTANSCKKHARWLSQISAAASLILVAYVRGKFAFVFGNTAGAIILIAMVAAVLTFIFSIASLPRWEGFVGLAAFCFVAYCLFFV
jgi:orotate phosphoribosyltransferase